MLEMLRAHGLDAGPTQRPFLAGAISGALADMPALALLAATGVLTTAGNSVQAAPALVAVVHAVAMVFGGIGYGALFRRAANDVAGGWLFGMAYGFLLWMVAPVPLLQWLPAQPLLVGVPAIGLFLAQLLWGLALGVCFKFVHRPLQSGIDGRMPATAEKAGSR